MSDERTWDELSDHYAAHTPEVVNEMDVPGRVLTMEDLDSIFAGRPLADSPRARAYIMAQTYLTEEINDQAKRAMEREHISMSALLRKALVSYLNTPVRSMTV